MTDQTTEDKLRAALEQICTITVQTSKNTYADDLQKIWMVSREALALPRSDPVADVLRRAALDEAVKACEQQSEVFASTEYATPQPIGSISERFVCRSCADAIRALAKSPATTQEHDAI